MLLGDDHQEVHAHRDEHPDKGLREPKRHDQTVVIGCQAGIGVGDGVTVVLAEVVLLDERELVARALVPTEDAATEDVAVEAALAELGDSAQRQVLLVFVDDTEGGHAAEPPGGGETDDEHRQRRRHGVLCLRQQVGLLVVERKVRVPGHEVVNPCVDVGAEERSVPRQDGERETEDDDEHWREPDHPGRDRAILFLEVAQPALEQPGHEVVLAAPLQGVPAVEDSEEPPEEPLRPVTHEDVPDGGVPYRPVP